MRRWRVGEVTITPVLELEWILEENWLIPQGTPEAMARHADWLRPHYTTERHEVILHVQSLIVESAGARVIVDTCIGDDKQRRSPRFNQMRTGWLERLADAGFSPGSIDVVLCTHLHFDHVGWNTRLENGRWTPTFSAARYLIGQREWEHARDLEHAHLDDSVRPVFDAGLVDLVEPGHRVTDEVWLEHTPGHTPGHMSVVIESKGERAIITGDMIHHPVQCAHPEWRCAADHDPEQGCVTRERFLRGCGGTSTLVIGSHFPEPGAGRIVRDGDAWRLVPDAS